MKKRAFSYIELMVAMTLVVIVAILTAPVMTSMGKKSTPVYGEFKCYARLVNNKWTLYQNVRINSDTYPSEDIKVLDKSPCKFIKPTGNITSYTVTLYGGGGSGSMPYFDFAKSNGIKFASGQNGAKGEEKSVVDSLEMAFSENNELYVYLCNENSDKNCIGKGGEVNTAPSSKTPTERIAKIINALTESDISASDIDYIKNAPCTDAKNALDVYQKRKTEDSKNSLKAALAKCPGISDSSKYTGNSGQKTRLLLANGKYAVAAGGIYGASDKYTGSKLYAISDLTPAGNDVYYYPASANSSVSGGYFTNYRGNDANNPTNVDIYENFGIGGGGGAFVCQIKDVENLSDLNTSSHITYQNDKVSYDEQCHEGYGGAGSGGAIIIQWN